MTPDLRSCKFVHLTDLVPDDMHWIYDALSDNAPFSWGDNDRTLVHASRVAEHVHDMLDRETSETVTQFLKQLDGLGEIYIDLEN